jgi:hypothetical protein
MPTAIVTALTPITLTGGRPAGPGESVDADPEADREHFETGALTLVETADEPQALVAPDTPRSRRNRRQSEEDS